MINEQLVSYVRQQVAAGVPQDTIKATLVANGWAMQDIEQVLAAPDAPVAVAPSVPLAPVVYAGFWRRASALFIDGLLLLSIYCGGVLVVLVAHVSFLETPDFFAMSYYCFALCVSVLYNPLLETSAWQGSVGKHLLGLRVTTLDGQKVSFVRALGRNLLKMLSGIFFIGYIMAGLTERKQALHDLLSGCLVVKHSSESPLSQRLLLLVAEVLLISATVAYAYGHMAVWLASNTTASPQWQQLQASVRDVQMLTTQRELELYAASHAGVYPASLSELQADLGQSTPTDTRILSFVYTRGVDTTSYTLCAPFDASAASSTLSHVTVHDGMQCLSSNADSTSSSAPDAPLPSATTTPSSSVVGVPTAAQATSSNHQLQSDVRSSQGSR